MGWNPKRVDSPKRCDHCEWKEWEFLTWTVVVIVAFWTFLILTVSPGTRREPGTPSPCSTSAIWTPRVGAVPLPTYERTVGTQKQRQVRDPCLDNIGTTNVNQNPPKG